MVVSIVLMLKELKIFLVLFMMADKIFFKVNEKILMSSLSRLWYDVKPEFAN